VKKFAIFDAGIFVGLGRAPLVREAPQRTAEHFGRLAAIESRVLQTIRDGRHDAVLRVLGREPERGAPLAEAPAFHYLNRKLVGGHVGVLP
jgi:hypothetical protein